MATILVAHGAWSAGWAWAKMHPLLRARSTPGWRLFELDASHSPNVTAPEALAALLDAIARG